MYTYIHILNVKLDILISYSHHILPDQMSVHCDSCDTNLCLHLYFRST